MGRRRVIATICKLGVRESNPTAAQSKRHCESFEETGTPCQGARCGRGFDLVAKLEMSDSVG